MNLFLNLLLWLQRVNAPPKLIPQFLLHQASKQINSELDDIRTKRRILLEDATKNGKVVDLELVFRILDEGKYQFTKRDSSYQEYCIWADNIKRSIVIKYPDGIPVDKAWLLATEDGWKKIIIPDEL